MSKNESNSRDDKYNSIYQKFIDKIISYISHQEMSMRKVLEYVGVVLISAGALMIFLQYPVPKDPKNTSYSSLPAHKDEDKKTDTSDRDPRRQRALSRRKSSTGRDTYSHRYKLVRTALNKATIQLDSIMEFKLNGRKDTFRLKVLHERTKEMIEFAKNMNKRNAVRQRSLDKRIDSLTHITDSLSKRAQRVSKMDSGLRGKLKQNRNAGNDDNRTDNRVQKLNREKDSLEEKVSGLESKITSLKTTITNTQKQIENSFGWIKLAIGAIVAGFLTIYASDS